MNKYKVWVLGVGESTYATNGLEFNDIESAKSYGIDLLYRWFGAESFVVLPVSEKYKGYLSLSVAEQMAVYDHKSR